MEVSINDMITKSVKETDHVGNLEETFKILRHYGIKVKPKNCTFGVRFREFFGYMIDQGGIKANPNKTKAILNMKSPTTMNEV